MEPIRITISTNAMGPIGIGGYIHAFGELLEIISEDENVSAGESAAMRAYMITLLQRLEIHAEREGVAR